MNVYRTYISSSTIMICTTKRNKSKFRKVSAAAIIAPAAGKYKPGQFSNNLFAQNLHKQRNQLYYHVSKVHVEAVLINKIIPKNQFQQM